MQNIYLPSRFYLTSLHDNFRILIKDQFENQYLRFFRDVLFFFFWLTLIKVNPNKAGLFEVSFSADVIIFFVSR